MRGAVVAGAGLLVVCGALALLAACGRKTPVRPPEAVAPATITGLTVTNSVGGVTLSWHRPTEDADGARLFDLDNFVVERANPGADFVFLVMVPVLDRNKLRQQRLFKYTDATADVGETYHYRVRSVTTDGFSSLPSNIVEIVRAVPTMTPTPIPTATPTRVEL
jgi:hypothetical protein